AGADPDVSVALEPQRPVAHELELRFEPAGDVAAEAADLVVVAQVEPRAAAEAAAATRQAEGVGAARRIGRDRRVERRPTGRVTTRAVELEQELAVAHVLAPPLPLARPGECSL